MAITPAEQKKYGLGDPGEGREWILTGSGQDLSAVLFDNNTMQGISNIDLSGRDPNVLQNDPSVKQFPSAPPENAPPKPSLLNPNTPRPSRLPSPQILPPAPAPTEASEVVPRNNFETSPVKGAIDRAKATHEKIRQRTAPPAVDTAPPVRPQPIPRPSIPLSGPKVDPPQLLEDVKLLDLEGMAPPKPAVAQGGPPPSVTPVRPAPLADPSILQKGRMQEAVDTFTGKPKPGPAIIQGGPPTSATPVRSNVSAPEVIEPEDAEVEGIEVVQPVSNQVKKQLGPPVEPPIEREPLEQARTEEEAIEAEPTISDTVTAMQEQTKKELGPFVSPPGEVIVTADSLLKQSKQGKSAKNKILINPNTNSAVVTNAEGDTLDSFSVGTGDTTGTRYGGQKYFSPVGSWKVVNQVPYTQVEGGYGPMWMGIDAKSYGLHGPHKEGDKAEDGGFANGGFVSHGCLRFSEEDIMRLSDLLDVGSSVEIMPYTTRPNHTGPLRVASK